MTEHLLEPPVNVIRLSLHPEGLARRIVNLDQWREHLVHRLRRERDIGADPRIEEILREIGEGDDPGWLEQSTPPPDLLVPLLLRSGDEVLSLVSATTVFGTPREVTLSELAIETFHPADDVTRAVLLGRHPR